MADERSKVQLAGIEWNEDGPDEDPRALLRSTLDLGDPAFPPMHLEAWAVNQVEASQPDVYTQQADWTDLADPLDGAYTAFGPDEPFDTAELGGRAYVVFAYPYA